jgi:hypothetical protein
VGYTPLKNFSDRRRPAIHRVRLVRGKHLLTETI